MKKFLLTMLLFMLVCGVWAVEDSFTITVAVEWLEINLLVADSSTNYTNWDLGTVAPGATNTMTTGTGGTHVLVDNFSNVSVDFSAYSTTVAPGACGYGTPVAWTPGSAAGADIYLLEGDDGTVSTEPTTYTTITATSAPGDQYLAGAPVGENHRFYARFTAPTSVSDGCTHTITVYIVAQ